MLPAGSCQPTISVGLRGVKYAASKLGLCRNEFRLPLTPISKANEEAIDFALSHAGLLPN